MRKVHFLSVSILLLFSAFISAEGWKAYTYKSMGCKISFPVEPEGSQQEIPTEVGSIVVQQYMAEWGEKALLIATNEYPEKYLSAKSTPEVIENALNGGVTGAANSIQGTIVESRDIKIGKHPGKQATITFQGGEAIDVLQIILVGNKMYQMQAIGMKDSSIKSDALLFFNSFRLL